MTGGPSADPPSRSAGQAPDTAAPGPGQVRLALYDVDPDTIAALVLACPAVAGLSGGPHGAAATYLPGRIVPGIRIEPDVIKVHVVTWYGPAVTELARQVRRALIGHVQGRSVDIVVEDIADAGDTGDPRGPAAGWTPADMPGTSPLVTSLRAARPLSAGSPPADLAGKLNRPWDPDRT